MNRRLALTTSALTVAAALILTGCSSHGTTHTKNTPTGTTSTTPTTTTPTGTPSTTTGTKTTPTKTPTHTSGPAAGLPILTPNPNSPALKVYNKTQVTQALELARQAGYGSLTDNTLLTKKTHPLGDYSAETQYLSPTGLSKFTGAYNNTNKQTDSNENAVDAYALSVNASSNFTPKMPITFSWQTYTPNLTVELDTTTNPNSPEMLVKGSIAVGLNGSAGTQQGALGISRSFTYYITPTGRADQPVAIDMWLANFKTAEKLVPVR